MGRISSREYSWGTIWRHILSQEIIKIINLLLLSYPIKWNIIISNFFKMLLKQISMYTEIEKVFMILGVPCYKKMPLSCMALAEVPTAPPGAQPVSLPVFCPKNRSTSIGRLDGLVLNDWCHRVNASHQGMKSNGRGIY